MYAVISFGSIIASLVSIRFRMRLPVLPCFFVIINLKTNSLKRLYKQEAIINKEAAGTLDNLAVDIDIVVLVEVQWTKDMAAFEVLVAVGTRLVLNTY